MDDDDEFVSMYEREGERTKPLTTSNDPPPAGRVRSQGRKA
jgi:hypothetical protein